MLSLPRWSILVLATLALGLSVLLWIRHRERAAVEFHERQIAADVAERERAAERAANIDAVERAGVDARADEQLRSAINEAVAEKPVEVRASAGIAVTRVLDRLRERASADHRSAD